ncbi:MAG: tetratricopeptide repeat protein [Chloroherpetonaceae bacterium]|nr:tetratricopeptide repeat protein [Chloroherpetonaceae bacterium]
MNPTDTATLSLLGIMAFQLERYSDAVDAFKKIAALKPNSRDAYRNIGNAYVKMKKFEEARDAYKKALAIDSMDVDAHYSLGICYYELGERDSVRLCYERIKDKNTYLAGALFRKLSK